MSQELTPEIITGTSWVNPDRYYHGLIIQRNPNGSGLVKLEGDGKIVAFTIAEAVCAVDNGGDLPAFGQYDDGIAWNTTVGTLVVLLLTVNSLNGELTAYRVTTLADYRRVKGLIKARQQAPRLLVRFTPAERPHVGDQRKGLRPSDIECRRLVGAA